MENQNSANKQTILLFVAVEEENAKQNMVVKPVSSKKQNDVDELTEIWELVKD